jgi:pimeloyl-ACP methyl ester carboxylesterase
MKPLLAKITLLVLLISSCDTPELESTDYLNTSEEKLINSQSYYSFSKQILNALAKGVFDRPAPYTFRDVDAIKIVYKTENYDGKEIVTSGVLLLPKIQGTLSLLSFHHGELLKTANAPSESTTGSKDLIYAALIASTGLAVLVPDYIGYGNSSLHWHPFEHKATLAKNSYDLYLASKEYLIQQRIKTNSKLYLTGFSEGGIATLALQRFLEEQTKINVTKTIVGNGAFAKVIWAKQLLSGSQNPEKIRYFARMVHSYNKIYPELNRPWNYYFNDAFMDLESNIDHLMELPQMVDDPKTLFTPSFIKGVLNETDTTFLDVLMENQIEGWLAEASIYFYRGSEDKIWNSTQIRLAAQTIENKGGTVKQKVLVGEDHESMTAPFVEHVLKHIYFE